MIISFLIGFGISGELISEDKSEDKVEVANVSTVNLTVLVGSFSSWLLLPAESENLLLAI